jgi:hypothetical protein
VSAINDNVILHRGLKITKYESDKKCNKTSHTYPFHVQYDIDLGKEYSVTMNIPYIDESESLV